MYYHSFEPSKSDMTKCKSCQVEARLHVCCICAHSLVGINAGELWCEVCWTKELNAQKELEASASQRVDEVKTRIPEPDSTIEIVSDIFNAKIASIEEIRREIAFDDTIVGEENKRFALAQRLESRYIHLVEVLKPKQQADLNDTSQEIRTIQTYYNDLAKKLKQEERDKIRIADVKYTPPDKPTKPIKAPSVKKYTDKEIKEASGITGIPERILKMMCYAQNISVKEAIQQYRQVMTKE